MWTAVFSTVFAGAATDIYFNRHEIQLRFKGEEVKLGQKEWLTFLSIIWSDVCLCILAILLNEFFADSCRLPFSVKRPSGTYRCMFGWRHIEGVVLLTATGGKFWVILQYTGVDGVINGLSNAYFGVWGSFFNSVFTLGTWVSVLHVSLLIVFDV